MSAAIADWIPPVNLDGDPAAPADGAPRGEEGRIRFISQVPLLADCGAREIRYIVEPLLPEASVIGLTGDSGSGKSTLACKLAAQAAAADHPVLILDRENPLVVVSDRYSRLSITDGNHHHHWGGWLQEEAPEPGAALVMHWVATSVQAGTAPLIILDSLVAFLRDDENSAQEMRAFMDQCRRLADIGATVVVLHHSGKSETSQDFRGSSDFKAAIDAGYHVLNFSPDMRLDVLRVRPFKSRLGLTQEVVYRYAEGRMTLDQNPSAPAQTANEQLTVILRHNPMVLQSKFEELAIKTGLNRRAAREFLNAGVLSGQIRRETGARNSRRYSLVTGQGDE